MAWVKLAMVLLSPLSPGPQFVGAQADREGSAERRWGSELMRLWLFFNGPPFVAAKAVQVKLAVMK
jgi:hypothetical protein